MTDTAQLEKLIGKLVNKIVKAKTIEEAHEEGELLLDEVVSVREIAVEGP